MREVDHRSSSHRSRYKSRSRSRDRDRDRDYYSRRRRSNSRSRTSKSSKKKKSKKKRYRSSSSSSSSSRTSVKSSSSSTRRTTTQPPSSEENSQSIQASSAAPKDLHVLSNYRDRGAIAKIDEDSFTATPFFSSAESKKVSEKVIIDLRNDTISVEEKDDVEEVQPESLLFHPNFTGDYMKKMEKWVKKLYNYRQKAFQED